ncbi:MAG TPA: site-2 protease family protein [Mycobacteriales bacterium]|nr:site-2 protease family protein [Mycobacteriales bacterium]
MSGDGADAFGAEWMPPPHPDSLLPPPVPSRPHTFRERLKRAFAPLAAIGAFLAKFGVILVKFKAFTVVGSMAVSIAAYTTLWGWKFALGFVLLIFVHEMGHVVVLRHRGIPASAPVFLPFLGAFVSMKQMPQSVYEEAESALAGPVFGAVGSLALWWVAHENGSGLLRALAFSGFILNLFNLLPMLPLDGGRVAGALHPAIWFLGLAVLLGLEIYRPSAVLLIILLFGSYELWRRWRDRSSTPSQTYFALEPYQRRRIAVGYLALIAVLVVGAHGTYAARTLS